MITALYAVSLFWETGTALESGCPSSADLETTEFHKKIKR